jgi:hypothetical protein
MHAINPPKCAKSGHLELEMKHPRHFESAAETVRETELIITLIADLDRGVKILDCEIATERELTRAFDRSDATYSMLARALEARRNNIKATVVALRGRLLKIVATRSHQVSTTAA